MTLNACLWVLVLAACLKFSDSMHALSSSSYLGNRPERCPWGFQQTSLNSLTSSRSHYRTSGFVHHRVPLHRLTRLDLFSLRRKMGLLPKRKTPRRVKTVNELREQLSRGIKFDYIRALGNTSVDDPHPQAKPYTSPTAYFSHPVIEAIRQRFASGSLPGGRTDGFKLGLVIEGGGMRGCTSAGMAYALHSMGLDNVFDAVYGSSAGSLIGAYFIGGQVVDGCKIYYNWLTRKGRHFVNKFRMFRTVGLSFLDPVDWWRDKLGSPVLNLNYLLDEVIKERVPLDFEAFASREKKVPLRIIASGLQSHRNLMLSRDRRHWECFDGLRQCLRASMLLPGVAGPPVRLYTNFDETYTRKLVGMTFPNNTMPRSPPPPSYGSEMLADALLFEAIPYRSAIKDGCTHVLVLRTRQDYENVSVAEGLTEWLTSRRFFKRKLGLDIMYQYVRDREHRRVYSEDVLRLNRWTWQEPPEKRRSWPSKYQLPWIRWTPEEDVNPNNAHLFCIAPQPHFEFNQVDRLEVSRRAIFSGVRRGFARAYEVMGAALQVDDYYKARARGHTLPSGINGRGWDAACEHLTEADFISERMKDSNR